MAENLKEQAYGRLHGKLIRGELSPGERLSTRVLAAEMGMSIIPIREAVSQLQSEGFVEYRSGVGSFVPQPSYEELVEIYDLRESIECHAAAKASQSITAADVAKLARCANEMAAVIGQLEQQARLQWDPELVAAWSTLDAKLHDTIMSAAGNRRALESVRRLRDMSHIFGRRIAGEPIARLRQTLAEHRRILEAIERGHAEEARRTMTEHICNGLQSLLHAHRRNRVATQQSE
jgi:DNA-binding GntR family transcriptional regulator